MSKAIGKKISLTSPQRYLCDLLHHSRLIPAVPIERTIDLSEVEPHWQQSTSRVSWQVIFLKALAHLQSEFVPLRRFYQPRPRPHLYECSQSGMSVPFEREWNEERYTFFAQIPHAHQLSLRDLQSTIHQLQTAPLETLPEVRKLLKYGKAPTMLRRWLWNWRLNWSGSRRVHHLGTAGISTSAGLMWGCYHPLSAWMPTLQFGAVVNGKVEMTLIYDHRVFDGGTAARAMTKLQQILSEKDSGGITISSTSSGGIKMWTSQRRFVNELLREAQQLPLTTIRRQMDLTELREAKAQSQSSIGWCALFTKAFGQLSERRKHLRRLYVPLPYPRIYEHPYSIASISVERFHEGQEGVYFTHIRNVECQPLAFIQEHLQYCKQVSLKGHALFRRVLNMGSWPGWFRRIAWWAGTHWSGGRRARHLGTFSVSTVSGLGAVSPRLLTPATCALNYGPINAQNMVDVYLTFDPRVLTASLANETLEELEIELNYGTVEQLIDVEPSKADQFSRSAFLSSKSSHQCEQQSELSDLSKVLQ